MPNSATVMNRDEAERVKALLAYEILDTLPDPALDEIAQLAASISGAPYAFLGLVDWARVWFKSRIGFSTRQIARAGSACELLVMEARPILIGDAEADPRFPPSGISLGDHLVCRSYAAAPLINSAGAVLGGLGIAAPEAHAFSRETLDLVAVLARQAMTRLDLYARGGEQERFLKARQQAERALTLERNFVSAILDTTSALVVVLDSAGRIVRMNRAGECASGRRLEELAGRIFPAEIWRPEDRDVVRELFEQARAGESPPPMEIAGQSPSGERRRISWTAASLKSDRGAASFVIMTGMDVTRKTEAEERLRSIMRQRESILASVGDGIWGMDLDGRLTFVNPSGASMLGYQPAEMLGKDIHALIHHSRPDRSPYPAEQCPILASLREGTPIRIRNDVFWKKGGVPFAVEYAASPLIDEGRVRGTVVAFQDETERRRLDRMKEEFIATVSHELRTPLTSLRAALGLISGGALANRPEKVPEMLDLAVGNCDRLVRLVNDIVDVERIGGSRAPLDRQDWSAIELLRRAIEGELAEATRAGLSFRLDAQPVHLFVDGELMLKAMAKLIQNAVKFSARGGEIRLSAAAAGEHDAIVSVEDEGCGIRPENLQRIFDCFEQGDASDTRASGGAGLGLAICQSIVVRHGGRIWAESSPGRGSTFSFTVARSAHPMGAPPE